ncbi:DUF6876 family protein [Aliterella atlantica]|uniref:DUF6876 domain-containing protein n=1 Tax=Aliterella atlantica CENA595 TaxID=1618023 RepID=A0A0D8ZN67_9CYAN|nr:DUF6876 family protein [Aliterella atlantica]KJH70248.1 hypothetical protein UH38_19050 [Aliterella atlantica CENA595]
MTTSTFANLDRFHGTERYYSHWLGIKLTDGAFYLQENGAAWLVDAIASHQTKKLLSDPMLKAIQFWTLTVNPDNSALLRCDRDEGDTALTQEIPFTDFPLSEIKLYLVEKVLMLPSEY